MDLKPTTAVLLTGASARISQEVAILDKLMQTEGLVLSPEECLLVGFSSGSLNVAAINGCFSKPKQIDWDIDYKEKLLFPLTSDQVYRKKILPWDTTPLHITLLRFLHSMKFREFGDFPFHSFIVTFSRRRLSTKWANSRKWGNRNLTAESVLMASTAIPVIFQAQPILGKWFKPRNFPYGKFNDGGTGGTFCRFEKVLGKYVKKNGRFTDMYIISPMREEADDHKENLFKELLNSSDDESSREVITDFMDRLLFRSFYKFLQKLDAWNEAHGAMADNIYVCIPEMKENFPVLKFDDQELQYQSVCQWVDENPTQLKRPLKEFLRDHRF